jgi:hypothetical protein
MKQKKKSEEGPTGKKEKRKMRGKKSRSNLVAAGSSQKRSTRSSSKTDTPPQSLVSLDSRPLIFHPPNLQSRSQVRDPKIATKRDSRIEREMTRQKSAEGPTHLVDFAQISCTRGRGAARDPVMVWGAHDVQRRVKRPPTSHPQRKETEADAAPDTAPQVAGTPTQSARRLPASVVHICTT